MLKEFRDFALMGNVVDLTKRVIIGAVRGMRVSSLDDGASLPVTDRIWSRTNSSNLFIVVSQPEQRPSFPFADARDVGCGSSRVRFVH